MRLLYVIICLLLGLQGHTQNSIIPAPQELTTKSGQFMLTDKTTIKISGSENEQANYLAKILESGFGKQPAIVKGNKTKQEQTITLQLNSSLKNSLGEEGYKLVINPKSLIIEGSTDTGLFYGIQTLRHILPPDFESKANPEQKVALHALTITDKPRFKWRSFMLDEARHFKGIVEVKRLLDQMALLKMNRFHWHLTDDQGWRIEIKKYPKLTQIGSIRKDTQTSRKSEERTGRSHQGFYTQEQIKEVVKYAQDRHIQIVPEIEMPGHAMAAIAAYPWLGSLGTTVEVSETFGKLEDSFDISNPKVVDFLKDVLREVFELFPGKVVHIGGDEVDYSAWENSEKIQKMMKKQHIDSPVDLQISFTNTMSNFIDDSGKRMMGWNEILGDDIHQKGKEAAKQTLAKSAIVHFWKGDLQLVNKAVSKGYDVVNSNHWDTYLDYTYKRLPLEKSYNFDPIPEGLDEKYHHKILGLGTQMWSEWIPTVEQMHQKIFPRLAAYAEVGWTSPSQKNYQHFLDALETLKLRWNYSDISYGQKED